VTEAVLGSRVELVRGSWLCLLALLFATGCGGKSRGSHDAQGASAGSPNGAGGTNDGGSGPVSASDAGDSGSAGSGAIMDCAPGSAPVRRLTRVEYAKTVQSLLSVSGGFGDQLPSEDLRDGFPNNAAAQSVSLELAHAYFTVAKAVAAQATNNWKPCAANVTAEACAKAFVTPFATAAYRRTLTDAELTELTDLYAVVRSSGGDERQAAASVITAVLQAPDFLYRLEWGVEDANRPDRLRLNGDEMATRLAYLFGAGGPDATLRQAARSGELDSSAGIQEQAARLLDNPTPGGAIDQFVAGLLPVDRLLDATRSDPGYSTALAQQMLDSAQFFSVNEVVSAKASWPELLTSPLAYGGPALAALYGVSGAASGNDDQPLSLDPTQRAGFLTQLAVLTSTTNKGSPSPTQRGLLVQDRLLCRPRPASHPNGPPVSAATFPGPTTRDRWTQAISGAACQSCHQEMDQMGFALGNYDSLGRYQTQENGAAIDSTADIAGLGSVSGPIELSQKLAASSEVQTCFVKRWIELGYGRSLDDSAADQCLTRDLNAAFKSTGYNVRELLLALTQTDAFLYLAKER
jgi:hypothetical protein